MANNRLKFETAESFKDKITKEFLPTLTSCVPCQVAGINFPHNFICSIQLLTQQGMKAYTIWINSETKFAEWCEGNIGKPQAKNIN